jgi:hypothetical protein
MKKTILKLPMTVYLVQCDCSEDNRLGYLEKKRPRKNHGDCKTTIIHKVKITNYDSLPNTTH